MNGHPLMPHPRLWAWAFAIVFTAALSVPAQMDQGLARAQQENAQALRKYEWKSRTEVRKDGETKKVQVETVRYDAGGNQQKTTISSTPEPDLPKFGLRKVIAKNKLKDFRETIAGLAAVAKSYSELPPERMRQFMATASITPELTDQHKLVRIEGRNLLQTGDSMTVFIDAISRKQRRIEIQTTFEMKPVRIVCDFQDLPGGPTYMARSHVTYDGDSIAIITENFDYLRVA